MIDGQNDTIVIGLQACAPVFATGSIDDAAEAGEEGSCCNGFQVDWLSEDVRRLLAAHGFTAPDPVDSVARRMVEREVLTPGMPLAAMPVESLYKPWTSLPGSQFGGARGLYLGDAARHVQALYEALKVEIPKRFAAMPDHLVYCFRHFSRSGRALYLPFQIWDKGRVEGGGRRTTSWDLALDDRIAPPTRSVTWIRQDGRSGLDI